ncbi:MAG: hypothetical protein KAX19_14220 [Candidatus Brocadiae bacterium]|nr:hypothetical protein [Candidatus Brocadiia bacterium]
MLEHEKLAVYPLLLRFVAWSGVLLEDVENSGVPRTRDVRDRLEQESMSALLHTTEGGGKRQGQLRAQRFEDARASATQCAACVDVLLAKGACTAAKAREGKEMLSDIVANLTELASLDADGTTVPELPEERQPEGTQLLEGAAEDEENERGVSASGDPGPS